jgi:hypothetical protein
LRDDLRARGVLDMLIAVTDKLTGMPTAVLFGKIRSLAIVMPRTQNSRTGSANVDF